MRSHRFRLDGAAFCGKLREAWLCDSCQEVTVTNELVSPPAYWRPSAHDPYRWAECPNCGCDTLYPFNFYRAERRKVVTHA